MCVLFLGRKRFGGKEVFLLLRVCGGCLYGVERRYFTQLCGLRDRESGGLRMSDGDVAGMCGLMRVDMGQMHVFRARDTEMLLLSVY